MMGRVNVARVFNTRHEMSINSCDVFYLLKVPPATHLDKQMMYLVDRQFGINYPIQLEHYEI